MSQPQGTFIVGNKLMGVCRWCGKLVRLDKPLLGGLHICSEERAIYEGRICGRCKALAEDCRCSRG